MKQRLMIVHPYWVHSRREIYQQLLIIIALVFILPISSIQAQNTVFGLNDPPARLEPDPCADNPALAEQLLEVLGPGFGYNYDSLYTDLAKWRLSPFAQIDSAGASVQNRALWLLTIKDTAINASPRYRISIHARTHPQEVQSSWVSNEMIKMLLSGDEFARIMLESCIFNIMPMYNPDGVELGYGRQNANGVDLESNWATNPREPEVEVLNGIFEDFMQSEIPICVALNMHSSSLGKRYFVYHHENGTSTAFAEDQKRFIGMIKANWPEGISDWNTFISWTNGTPNYYPESWFWLNYGEAVMALTYEDIFGETDYGFDLAAMAILKGIADYLGISHQTPIADKTSRLQSLPKASLRVYPNPVSKNSLATIQLNTKNPESANLTLYDILGRKIRELASGKNESHTKTWHLSTIDLASGRYFLGLDDGQTSITIPLTVQR